ncbi:MAG: hypothetical protein AB1921_12990 [Thermodesulfobacteriota bacterium]
MDNGLDKAREHFIQALCRIARFWGFPKAMGAVYGAIYLSPEALTLDDLVRLAGVSKGSASIQVRSLERLRMIRKDLRVGDRKDYYSPETDFWKMIKSILGQREKQEFDRALGAVAESLDMVHKAGAADLIRAAFLADRMKAMKDFFGQLDGLVRIILALDSLKAPFPGMTTGENGNEPR